MNDLSFYFGMVTASIFIGCITGAIPLFTAVFKGRRIWIGIAGFFVCLVVSFIGGLLLGIPASAIFTYFIMRPLPNNKDTKNLSKEE